MKLASLARAALIVALAAGLALAFANRQHFSQEALQAWLASAGSGVPRAGGKAPEELAGAAAVCGSNASNDRAKSPRRTIEHSVDNECSAYCKHQANLIKSQEVRI